MKTEKNKQSADTQNPEKPDAKTTKQTETQPKGNETQEAKETPDPNEQTESEGSEATPETPAPFDITKIQPIFSARIMPDTDESIEERAVKAISNGVITQWQPVIDEVTGDVKTNDDTGRPMQKPLDDTQATVWQTAYMDRGAIPADILFPDNPIATKFEAMVTSHNRVTLYQVHTPLLDAEKNPIQLPTDPNKYQHGHYLLLVVLPKAQKVRDQQNRLIDDPLGSPRDQFLNQFCEDLPEFVQDRSVATGEKVLAYLLEHSDRTNIEDLWRRITVPKATSGREIAAPENIIFLRADSGYEGLYVNRTTRAPRTRGRRTELPETTVQGGETKNPLSTVN